MKRFIVVQIVGALAVLDTGSMCVAPFATKKDAARAVAQCNETFEMAERFVWWRLAIGKVERGSILTLEAA